MITFVKRYQAKSKRYNNLKFVSEKYRGTVKPVRGDTKKVSKGSAAEGFITTYEALAILKHYAVTRNRSPMPGKRVPGFPELRRVLDQSTEAIYAWTMRKQSLRVSWPRRSSRLKNNTNRRHLKVDINGVIGFYIKELLKATRDSAEPVQVPGLCEIRREEIPISALPKHAKKYNSRGKWYLIDPFSDTLKPMYKITAIRRNTYTGLKPWVQALTTFTRNKNLYKEVGFMYDLHPEGKFYLESKKKSLYD